MNATCSLSPQEDRLLTYLTKQGYDTDVAIRELFTVAIGEDKSSEHRTLQQRLGACVSKLNRKLGASNFGGRIVPGKLKRTYRLVRT